MQNGQSHRGIWLVYQMRWDVLGVTENSLKVSFGPWQLSVVSGGGGGGGAGVCHEKLTPSCRELL